MGRVEDVMAAVRANPREYGFVAWVLGTVALQRVQARRAAREGPADFKRVRVARTKAFTMANDGGTADLSVLASLEFWATTAVRGAEAALIFKTGLAFYNHEWRRFRNLSWAAFCLLPMLDQLVPEDWANPDPAENRHRLWRFRLPLYLWAVIELYTTSKGVEAIASPASKLTTWDKLGVLGALGLFNGGIGITIAHELGHAPNKLEKFLSNLLLLNVNYLHWGPEHVHGHHTNVATHKDPATARFGESIYTFLPRTVIGTWLSSWRHARAKFGEAGGNARMLAYAVAPLVWASIIARRCGGGKRAIAAFYVQGLLSASLLELVNFTEHYGLTRDKLPDGSYEPVNPTHSWNSSHRLSNAFLFKLQRHSDHHTFAMRPYHLLRSFKESPTLPTGYPGMITLACVPPLFRWVMDPLVKAAKVKPENYKDGKDFAKDQQWIEAEVTAKRKITFLSTAVFVLSTWALIRSERAFQSRRHV